MTLYILYSKIGRKKNSRLIRHYEDGQVKPFELKPMDMEQYGLITKYTVSAYKHEDEYNFYDAESVVSNFLSNAKNRFVANNDVIMKVGFTTENIQPSPEEIGTPIINSRYWSTEPFRTSHFNDYVFFSLKENTENRVIANGMSGSSWQFQFRRFLHLNLSVMEQKGSITA